MNSVFRGSVAALAITLVAILFALMLTRCARYTLNVESSVEYWTVTCSGCDRNIDLADLTAVRGKVVFSCRHCGGDTVTTREVAADPTTPYDICFPK